MRSPELLAKFNAARDPRWATTPQHISSELPASFDTRTQWPGCIGAAGILDQGKCGSCWAFAMTETLSDRFCIYSNGKVNVTLSPQYALDCEEAHWGCFMGSMPEWAWDFAVTKGVATMDCVPYTAGNGTTERHDCVSQCAAAAQPLALYYAANYSQAGDLLLPSKHTEAIMRALMQGPLDATFIVYQDFYQYQAGQVYQHTSGRPVGLHSVKIIGYGEQNGQPYWNVQNSWGTDFGLDGTFMILRGKDECGFESQVFAGFPLFN